MGYKRVLAALGVWTLSLCLAPSTSFLSLYSQQIRDSFSQNLFAADANDSNREEPKWAYAFLVAGINLEKPTYRGFLYNIAVSAHIFQLQGSRADVVVLLQMDPGYEKLPEEDERLLQAENIRVQYLPPLGTKEKSFFFSLLTVVRHALVSTR